MANGVLFDIKEFALNDGPGVRLTLFMKGCPLRCVWCHNPEGLSFEPQYNSKTEKVVGKSYTPEQMAAHVNKFKDIFELSGGGVTFSGGEPTAQADFVVETCGLMSGIHKCLDTSGYCESGKFAKILKHFDLVYFDLKVVDNELHERVTGVSNDLILKNLKAVADSGIKFHIRVPLIDGITSTSENLDAIYSVVSSLSNKPFMVDLLPYNRLAGAKYSSYDMQYSLGDNLDSYDENIINEYREKFKELIK